MAKRKLSIDTKEIIYTNAKKLFYEKGYQATSYDEICKSANLNPAMLKYHFGSKKEIAALIYKEITYDLYYIITKLLASCSDPDIIYLIINLSFFKLVKEDYNFQRFYLDLCKNRIINDYTKETTIEMFEKYLHDIHSPMSKSEMTIIASISVSAQSELINDFFGKKFTVDFDYIIDTYLELMFGYLMHNTKLIKEKSIYAKKLMENYSILSFPAFEIKILKKDKKIN